jgi:sec-independent protein translocase protein TatA
VKGCFGWKNMVAKLMFDYQNSLLLGWGIGWQELVIVAGIFLLLFGGQKLPGLMRNLGRSVNEFKAGIKEKPVDGKIEEE